MFALALWLCSAGVVQKYLGTAAALVYAPVCVASALVTRALLRRRDGVPERLAFAAVLAAGVVAVAALIVVYPHANAQSATAGSDRDDAATIGARHLLDGEYPYSERTYLGNPISQF